MMNKIEYGLSECHYSIYTKNGYSTPVKIAGAVSLSLSSNIKEVTKKIKGIDYAIGYSGSGYTGTLEMINIPDYFLCDVMGHIKDDNGILKETQIKKTVHFALLHEIKGDYEKKRICWYNCICRPFDYSKAQQFESVKIPIIVTPKNNIIKSICKKSDGDIYNNWFNEVYL